jgi:hypothetical protein
MIDVTVIPNQFVISQAIETIAGALRADGMPDFLESIVVCAMFLGMGEYKEDRWMRRLRIIGF